MQRGSLSILCALELGDLERRSRAARGLRAAAGWCLALAASALAWLHLGPAAPPVRLAVLPAGATRLTASLAGASLALAAVAHATSRRTARRRELYRRLERTVDPCERLHGP